MIVSGWRNWLLAGGLSVAMHAGLLWSVAETATTPQFRIAQEFSITLVRQSEQRTKSAPPPAPAAAPSPKANPPVPESREQARVQPERQTRQPERQPTHDSTPEPQTPADSVEAADRLDSAGQPAPQTKQANYSADYLNNPLPHYPNAARRRGLEGQVLLNVEVLATGECGRVDILQSSGHAILDEAAIEAVKRWHFVPASDAGMPVGHWLHIPIRFRLSGRNSG